MHAGETLQVQIIRNGKVLIVPVLLLTGKRSTMAYTDPAGLGAVRSNTWLEQTLTKNDLRAWADTIARQIAGVADMDFCDAPFTTRSNPFRLNVVTYLDHYPLRVGAVSRAIDQQVWDGVTTAHGIAGALDAAARQLGYAQESNSTSPLPTNPADLSHYFSQVHTLLRQAYAGAQQPLDGLAKGLSNLLNVDSNWEDAVDSLKDPELQLAARTRVEGSLVTLLGEADKVDMGKMIAGARLLAQLADTNWMRSFAAAYQKGAKPIASKVPGVDGTVLAQWETPAGRCVIGGPGPNRYTGNFAFIMDIGGNDVYDLTTCAAGSFRMTIDLAGDDDYRGSQSAAAGVGCVDVLVDRQGNDTYRGERWSQGAGCLGVGMLIDYAGDDIYTSHWCSQGAAFLGIGLLYDHSGYDHYVADVYSQGFGYAKGFGMLLEDSGNDSYRAGWKYPDDRWPNRAHLAMSQGFGYGMRPWSTGVGTDGGIGLLSDRQGDDVYDAGIFSQGGSYWYALGILHDRQGADRYSAGQYSQGSGIHLSFGALLDDAGDDSYDAYAWLEQGNAHDWSSGCLEDGAGNDTYRASGASQGCGFFVSFGYLLDAHGDDRYYLKPSDTSNSEGGGNYIPPRHSGSLGVLLDLGHGDDVYTDTRMKPGEAVIKSAKGIGYDDGEAEKK
jgi:hypothetical protein